MLAGRSLWKFTTWLRTGISFYLLANYPRILSRLVQPGYVGGLTRSLSHEQNQAERSDTDFGSVGSEPFATDLSTDLNRSPDHAISMAISGTDLLEVPTICKAYFLGLNFREYPQKIWPYMVQYLHFRILKFPLTIWKVVSKHGE